MAHATPNKRKAPAKAPADDDDFSVLPTPPKAVKPAFEQNLPVEVRALMYSDKASQTGPTGNYALWMNPTRKYNRKPGGGDPGFNNNQAVETALATAGLQQPVKCACLLGSDVPGVPFRSPFAASACLPLTCLHCLASQVERRRARPHAASLGHRLRCAD